jgi:hypothetical protein
MNAVETRQKKYDENFRQNNLLTFDETKLSLLTSRAAAEL